MEPNYVGANGRVDAMAAAWLLDEDHVFFLDHEITWDGRNHGFAGAQLNAANMDEAPVLSSNYETIISGVLDLMMELEGDEALRVSRGSIHPALHGAIREGDLTGITLFNLIACGHAIRIDRMQEDGYRVIYDNRLARGIPAFYKLVARMIEDMREYNGTGGAFQVMFGSARNFDADQYLKDFDGTVSGAVSEPAWVERVGGAPPAEGTSETGESSADADEAEEREGAGTWTFGQGKAAKGRRFSIGLPDQFAAVDGCGGRPLAVPAGDLESGADSMYLESAQVIYSDMVGDLGEETREAYADAFTPGAKAQMNRDTMYGKVENPLGGGVSGDWIVEGRNCLVQVFEVQLPSLTGGQAPGGYEYYVKPVAFDHEDQLRVTDSFGSLQPGELKQLALAIARTVELDEPVELRLVSDLDRYLEETASPEGFANVVDALKGTLVLSAGWRMSADCWREKRLLGDDFDAFRERSPWVLAESFNEALEERVDCFSRLLDVLAAQKALGNTQYGAMWSLVGDAGDSLVVDRLDIDGGDKMSAAANATNAIRIPDRYEGLRERWRSLEPERGAEPAHLEAPLASRAREIVGLSRAAVWENLGLGADNALDERLSEFAEDLVYTLVDQGLRGQGAVVDGDWVAENVPLPHSGNPRQDAPRLIEQLESRTEGGLACRAGKGYVIRLTLIEDLIAEHGMGRKADSLIAEELERAREEISEAAEELARLESEESRRIEAMTTFERALELGDRDAVAIEALNREVAALEADIAPKPESSYAAAVQEAESRVAEEALKLERLQAKREELERELESLSGLFKGRARKEVEARLKEVKPEIEEARTRESDAEAAAESARRKLDEHRRKRLERDEKRARIEKLESELERRSGELVVGNAFSARRQEFEAKYVDAEGRGAWRWMSIPRDPYTAVEDPSRAIPTEFTKSEYMALAVIPELREVDSTRMDAGYIGDLCGGAPFEIEWANAIFDRKEPKAKTLVARRLLEWGLLEISNTGETPLYRTSARLVSGKGSYDSRYFERATGIDKRRTEDYQKVVGRIREEQSEERAKNADAERVVAVLESERDPLERHDLRMRVKSLNGTFDDAVLRAKEQGLIKEIRIRRDVFYALASWAPKDY